MKQKQNNNLYGKARKRIELNDFVLTETIYPAQAVLPKHSHSDAYFCFVLQGTFNEQYENRNRFCRASSVVLHPSGEAHADQFGANESRCFNLQPTNDWLKRVRDYAIVLDEPLEFQGGKMAQLFGRLYHEFRYFDAVSPLAIESLSLEIAVAAFREKKSSEHGQLPVWLRTAKELIHDNVFEELNLSRIAESVGVHPVHLARVFRSSYGCSVGQYVRNLKIENASRILSSSEKPISEIAYKFGFSSQSHFTTLFKRVTNLTPAEYRKLFRK